MSTFFIPRLPEHLAENEALLIEAGGEFASEDIDSNLLPNTLTSAMKPDLADAVPITFKNLLEAHMPQE